MPQEICPYPWCSLCQSITKKICDNNSWRHGIGLPVVYSVYQQLSLKMLITLRLVDFIPSLDNKLLKELYKLHPGIVQGWLYYREWVLENDWWQH